MAPTARESMTGSADAPLFDTVDHAASTPDTPQPWAQLGLKEDEYQRVRELLGRRPTAGELPMYSVMWSEHCSYKSSKVHLRQFGEKTDEAMRKHLMVGIGENAGVVDIGEGWAVTFKVESHNHPSFVEPYQGAATGVGGIVRDIMSMGARPVAVMDQLRFGAISHPDTARVVHGVVAGVGGYGNCLGLPNIGGEVVFDPSYQGNPLVNALCVGVLRHEDVHLANASGVGNKVVLFGARTGGDGIGGASILASETFVDGVPSKRPSVQVGEPFLAITRKWDVETAIIGEVTDGTRLTIDHHGHRIVDVDPHTVANGPVYHRPYARPAWQDGLQADTISGPDGAARYARPTTGEELRATLLRLVASPNLASKAWVTDQYDRFVQGNTALAQPDDAGVVRVDEATGLGVALATDGNGRYAKLDPYACLL